MQGRCRLPAADGASKEAMRGASTPRRVGTTKYTRYTKTRAHRPNARDVAWRVSWGKFLGEPFRARGLQPGSASRLRPGTATLRERLGAPKGQPHASPGQRPGFPRPMDISPEGAGHVWEWRRKPWFGKPFQGLDGSWASQPGALPRAGVGRAAGASGPCKASPLRVHHAVR
jgi:hypothetical protein